MTPEQFIATLEAAPAALAGLSYREPLIEAAREVGHVVDGNFLRNEDESGVRWAPHAPATVAKHGPHELLRLTYAMHAAATDFDSANGSRDVGDREITFGVDGTEIPYARYQQSGTSKIPARQFFYVREADMPRVVASFSESALAVIRREVFE